jgi:PEP-CTERM motif-containing protein
VSAATSFPTTIEAAWLYTINPTTGVATLVGQIKDGSGGSFNGGLSGIAFETSPEPGTIGLMFIGLTALAFSRRRLLKRWPF